MPATAVHLDLSERGLELLRTSITLSEEAKQRSHHPFAALVADEQARSSPAQTTIRCRPEAISHWTGIGGIVYALSEHSLL